MFALPFRSTTFAKFILSDKQWKHTLSHTHPQKRGHTCIYDTLDKGNQNERAHLLAESPKSMGGNYSGILDMCVLEAKKNKLRVVKPFGMLVITLF